MKVIVKSTGRYANVKLEKPAVYSEVGSDDKDAIYYEDELIFIKDVGELVSDNRILSEDKKECNECCNCNDCNKDDDTLDWLSVLRENKQRYLRLEEVDDEANESDVSCSTVDKLDFTTPQKLTGWVARNKNGLLKLFISNKKPERSGDVVWIHNDVSSNLIDSDMFPYRRWCDEPMKVELVLNVVPE